MFSQVLKKNSHVVGDCWRFLRVVFLFFVFAELTRAASAAAPWPSAALWSQRAAAPSSLPACAPKLRRPPSLWALAVGLLEASWAERAWLSSVPNGPPPAVEVTAYRVNRVKMQILHFALRGWLVVQLFVTNVFQTFGKSGVWDFWGDASGSGSSTAPWDWKMAPPPSLCVICRVSIAVFFSAK